MSRRREVAIIGMGAVTPLGHTLEETWQALEDPSRRAAQYERPWIEKQLTEMGSEAYIPHFTSQLAGRIRGFNFLSDTVLAERIRERDVERFYSPSAQYFMHASIEAGRQAGLLEDDLRLPEKERRKAAVVVGTGAGGAAEIPGFAMQMTQGKRLSPFDMSKSQPDNPMVALSMLIQALGDNETLVRACASGGTAVAHGARLIRNREADVVFAGGTEGFNPTVLAEFEKTHAASESDNPDDAPWPFRHIDAEDKGGAVLGEGAGVVVMVPLDKAKAMGTEVLGIVRGWDGTSDGTHWTMLSGEGTVRSMKEALRKSRIGRDIRLLVGAHATGAGRKDSKRAGDRTEALAIHQVFSGKRGAYKPEQIENNVVALKERLTHLVGGAKGAELVINMLMMLRGQMLPTQLDWVMPEGEGLVRTAHEGQPLDADGILSNGMGFGGSNSSIVVVKPSVI